MTHGAGVFQRLLHVIPDDAQIIAFHGIDVTFGGCGLPCVPIEEPPEGTWPPCHPCGQCFPTQVPPPEGES